MKKYQMPDAGPTFSELINRIKNDGVTVCVIGLGYVGTTLVESFAKVFKVIGFDIDSQKVKQLRKNNCNKNITFTTNSKEIRKADFVIICVPTPVTKSKEPDLSYIESAARIVGKNLKKNSIVILESTVYPGVTEDFLKPILEEESGLKCGEDFKIAYSPERVNPGDKEHTLKTIVKVVAGMDEETTEIVAELYKNVCDNIFKAKNIKIAEAAKVIENIQRDLNIALMNELSLIFEKMGIDTKEVIRTAATKWNFHVYYPGLVGGHCIPVDPYYLVHKAKELGYHPQVILAGRAVNDYMPKHVALMAIKALNYVEKVPKKSKVLIMGLTYKENVRDTRETPVKGIIEELREYGVEIFGYDPLLTPDEIEKFGIKVLENLESTKTKMDCIIVTVAHDEFKKIPLGKLKELMSDNPVLIDVRGIYKKETKQGIYYKTL